MQVVTSMWMRPRAAFAGLAGPAGTAPVLACRPSYLSPLAWLALQAAALWPHGAWMARRVQDGSDEPLGLAALALLLMLLVMILTMTLIAWPWPKHRPSGSHSHRD